MIVTKNPPVLHLAGHKLRRSSNLRETIETIVHSFGERRIEEKPYPVALLFRYRKSGASCFRAGFFVFNALGYTLHAL